MPKVSNPRDLLLQLLGEALYIERRLVGGVLRDLAGAVHDEQLRAALEQHLEQTRAHVEHAEQAFRAVEAAPTANRSADFEAAVAAHDELSSNVAEPRLADVFHAQAALRTEHLEIAIYTTVLSLGFDDALAPLRESLADEYEAREILEGELRRLAEAG